MSGTPSGTFLLRNNGAVENVADGPERAGQGAKLLEIVQDPDDGKCLKCPVADRQGRCVPCGHKTFCNKCGAARDEGRLCPLCRFPVTSFTDGLRAVAVGGPAGASMPTAVFRCPGADVRGRGLSWDTWVVTRGKVGATAALG
jgi:hypothetical protein